LSDTNTLPENFEDDDQNLSETDVSHQFTGMNFVEENSAENSSEFPTSDAADTVENSFDPLRSIEEVAHLCAPSPLVEVSFTALEITPLEIKSEPRPADEFAHSDLVSSVSAPCSEGIGTFDGSDAARVVESSQSSAFISCDVENATEGIKLEPQESEAEISASVSSSHEKRFVCLKCGLPFKYKSKLFQHVSTSIFHTIDYLRISLPFNYRYPVPALNFFLCTSIYAAVLCLLSYEYRYHFRYPVLLIPDTDLQVSEGFIGSGSGTRDFISDSESGTGLQHLRKSAKK
jgi:hypothetical protein